MTTEVQTGSPALDKNALAGRLDGIEGWLYANEAWKLYDCARAAAQRHATGGKATIVEIGSWKGRSTVALALGAIAAGGNATVYAIDPHSALTKEHVAEYGDVDTYADFLSNIRRAGVASFVEPLRMTSEQAAEQFEPSSIDFLFVDGSHEYEHVKDDLLRYIPLLKDDAAIAFNDPSRPGVYRALREEVLRPRSAFRAPDLVENTLFFDFARTTPASRDDRARMRRLRSVLRIRALAATVRPWMPMWFVRLGHRLSRRLVRNTAAASGA